MRWRSFAYLVPAFAVAATTALAALSLVGALAAHDRPFPGFLMYTNGAVTSLMRRSWEGPRVGLLPRDIVRAVDGVPAHSAAEATALLGHHAPGEIASVEVTRPSAPTPLRVRVRVGRLGLGDLGFVFVMPFAIGVLYLGLGAIVFFVKRTRAAALVLALSLWAAAFYLTMFDAHFTYRWSRLWVCYPLLGAISIHLFAVFPEERPRVARAIVLGPVYTAGVLLAVLREVYIDNPLAFDATSFVSGLFLAGSFIADLALLGVTFTRTRVLAVRSKARTLAFGLVATISLALVWAFVSRIGPRLITADQAMLLSAAFPVLMGYATVRQNLFDLDAVLQKSLTYGAVSVLVVGLYLLAVAFVSAVASPLATRWSPFASPQATAIVATLIIAAAASPLRAYVQKTVARVFYSETVDLADALVRLARDLERAETPPELGERVVTQLARVLDLRGAALLVANERRGHMVVLGRTGELEDVALPLAGRLGDRLAAATRPLRAAELAGNAEIGAEVGADVGRLGASVLVPLRARGRLRGLLALGPRRDGEELRVGDLELVAATATPLAIAVENAALVAERADRERLAALGAVAAVIVHEVKNPLGIIRVSASTLEKKFAEGDSGRELAECIVEEVDRMDSTLRQILSFARPQPPALGPCDVSSLIERTCARMRPQLSASRVRIATDLDGAPPVQADPQQLERVLVNLLANSAAAMAERGGEIQISARPVRRLLGRRAVEIAIADSGCGMDEGTRRRLFEPFFTTRPGGTGLGLAIVKQILDEHHGEITVESQPGQGSVFRVTLPA
jgi:signal transduction histidine kinase